MTALAVTQRDGSVRFTVWVKPRSSRSRVEGTREDGSLVVALEAPPVEGAANAGLIRLLAGALGVKKAAVRIAAGQNARRKVIEVEGVTREDVLALIR